MANWTRYRLLIKTATLWRTQSFSSWTKRANIWNNQHHPWDFCWLMLIVFFNMKQLHLFIEPLASHFISPDQLLFLLLKVFVFWERIQQVLGWFVLRTDTCPLTSSQTAALLTDVFSIPCCLDLHTQFAAGLLRKAATSTSSLVSWCLF